MPQREYHGLELVIMDAAMEIIHEKIIEDRFATPMAANLMVEEFSAKTKADWLESYCEKTLTTYQKANNPKPFKAYFRSMPYGHSRRLNTKF